MEATGNYGFLLLYLLHQGGIAVSLVNPKQIKHFARMMMAVTKTDEKDACMIAMYGEKMNPPIYKMPSQAIILLKQKKTVIRQLRKQLVASKNLRGSLVVLPYRDKACVRALDKTIDFLTRQIEQLEAELADIASSEFDKQLKDSDIHQRNWHYACYGTDPYNRRIYLLRQCKATVPLHRNMSYLPTIGNIRKYQRAYKPEW